MLYTAYQASEDLLAPSRMWSAAIAHGVGLIPTPFQNPWTRHVRAAAELADINRVRHERPAWAIHEVVADGHRVAVQEEAADATPFCTLRHFVKDVDDPGPAVLIVAP